MNIRMLNGNLTKKYHYHILAMLLLFTITTFGAIDTKQVETLIDAKKYEQAYNILNVPEAHTPEELYLQGLCLYHLNKDLNQALVMLTKALSNNGPDEIKLVLGLIYHKQYRTDEAIRILKDYVNIGKDQQKKELALKYIDHCKNLNAVAHRGKVVNVLEAKKMKLDQLAMSYNEKDLVDIVVPKQESLLTKEDENMGVLDNMMFIPKITDNVKFVYYSAYIPGRPNHSDIFRAKVSDDGEFIEAENLGATINSHSDEINPYFDEDNQVLYFASKGHQSIGGFDIFMSYYNVGAESWSKPVNIGLPFNSSSDDFMYCAENTDYTFVFATNRNTAFGEAEILKILVKPGATYQTLVTPVDMIRFNTLKTNGAVASNNVSQNVGDSNNPEYKKLVENALNAQVKADSVKRRVHEQQQKIDVALGESRKLALQSDMKIMQEEHRVLQEKANNSYEEVRRWERDHNMVATEVADKAPIEQVKEVNDIKVYQYTNENSVNPVKEEITKEVVEKKEATKQVEKDNRSLTVVKEGKQLNIANLKTSNDLPDKVVYTVQIGVFSKVLDDGQFPELNQVFYYYIADRGLYKYYTGVYDDLLKARQHLSEAQNSGFPDAFMAAFHNKQPVSIGKAKELIQKN